MQSDVEGVMVMARGISDLGVLIITAACFLFISLITYITLLFITKKQTNNVINQFNALIKNLVESQQTKLDAILEYARQNESKITQLKEAITGEEFNKIRVATNYGFDFNKLSVALLINETKQANNLDQKREIESQVRMAIDNLYNRFSSELDYYEYNGRKASDFLEIEWKERIYDFCMKSIYDEKSVHCKYYIKLLSHYFDEFKVKFYEKLKKT